MVLVLGLCNPPSRQHSGPPLFPFGLLLSVWMWCPARLCEAFGAAFSFGSSLLSVVLRICCASASFSLSDSLASGFLGVVLARNSVILVSATVGLRLLVYAELVAAPLRWSAAVVFSPGSALGVVAPELAASGSASCSVADASFPGSAAGASSPMPASGFAVSSS